MEISESVILFFKSQSFVIVSTIDKNGNLHNSCKGLVEINKHGRVYLLDLYKGETYENIKNNPKIAISAVDEHKFKGYCLKGSAEEIGDKKLQPRILKTWEQKVNSRITQRVLRNLKSDKAHGHPLHPEVQLPKPQYMIVMSVDGIVDLTPHPLRQREE